MAKKRKESYFWTSYSDLMTNLFFVMLMLFILAIALLHREMVQIGKERDATKAEIEKINEIRNAIQKIDTTYFQYVPEYKKHILKTRVKFRSGSSNMNDLDQATQKELLAVRDTIKSFLENLLKKDSEASYLLIIEGQASKDGYALNNQLSYERALSLFKFWFPDQKSTTLRFFNMPCEVVIAGAGFMEGKPRDSDNSSNQRFLIQIMPQSGIIE